MTRFRFGVLTGCLLVGGWLVAPVAGQDLNTMLVNFLRDLAAGTLGTSNALTSITFNATGSKIASSVDGKFKYSNNAGTAGHCVDATTNGKALFYGSDCSTAGTVGNSFIQLNGSTGSIDVVGSANAYDVGSTTKPLRSVVAGTDFMLANATTGQNLDIRTLTELTTIAAAATTDTTIQMPANSVVLSVAVLVTTTIPTCATFTVGDSGSAARFSTTTVSCAATSSNVGTKAGAYYNASALSIRITPNAQPADTTGRVRVVIYYYVVTAPTS